MTAMPNLYHRLLHDHGPSPVVTCYDQGGRVELSGRVLANWVAKAASLLIDDCEVEPGDAVAIDLPSHHWRGAYWALAAWAVGATVVVPHEVAPLDAAVVLTHRHPAWLGHLEPEQIIAVDLSLLPRPMPECEVMQEAGTIGPHPDALGHWEGVPAATPVLLAGAVAHTWREVNLATVDHAAARLVLTGVTPLAHMVMRVAAAVAGTGSVVLVEASDPAQVSHIADVEHATPLTLS